MVIGIYSYSQIFVSKDEAIKVAITYRSMQENTTKSFLRQNVNQCYTITRRNKVLIYEVKFNDGYSILLSGVKNCIPILGYNLSSSFNINPLFSNLNIPPGLNYFLEKYCDEIEYLIDSSSNKNLIKTEWVNLLRDSFVTNTISLSSGTVYGPLLTTNWGQSESNNGNCDAYNYYITISNNDCNCNSFHCPVGCVATAMAQIMNYWKYPVYLPNKTEQYDWCNMSDKLYSYSPNYEKERNAIARLMKDCADASNMHYCYSNQCQSFTWSIDARNAFVDDFGYSSDADRQLKSSYSINTWKGRIKNNINNGWPILYSGVSYPSKGYEASGHAFVCDGYNSDDKYHFNWGWIDNSGYYDYWLTLDNLVPDPSYNYSHLERAIFYIYPNNTQDYCNFSLPLWAHYYMYYTVAGNTSPLPYENVPKIFTNLTSVPSGNGFPTSWHTIEAGQRVEYVAHENIRLLPGFHVKKGSYFVARIEPCFGCNTTNRSLVSNTIMEDDVYNLIGFEDSLSFGQKSHKNNLSDMNNEIEKFTLFPNPNSGSFTIGINDISKIQQIQVFNPIGQRVYNVENPDNNTVNLPSGAKGTFFVKITTQTETVVKKIMVE
jgi:hypothetical protein